jgi:hypothetical protein
MDDVRTEKRELTTADIAREARPGNAGSAAAAVMEPPEADPGGKDTPHEPLFAAAEAGPMRERWTSIQAAFVDEPRDAVRHADELVADAIKRLAESFARERSRLEEQWGRSGDVSTEDLRQALRRYRSFFDRLLSV